MTVEGNVMNEDSQQQEGVSGTPTFVADGGKKEMVWEVRVRRELGAEGRKNFKNLP